MPGRGRISSSNPSPRRLVLATLASSGAHGVHLSGAGVDDLPLALELAAACAKALSPRQTGAAMSLEETIELARSLAGC